MKYKIEVSKRKNKKYDVYKILDNNEVEYLLSFGSKSNDQYFDRLGYYSDVNHNDEKRKESYLKRHQNDYLEDPEYAGFWAKYILWDKNSLLE